MSDVRRLMGRLYPPGMKYTVGFTGRPTIAPEDIAGALGFIRDRFAREVFCTVWWPEGAILTGKQFDLELRRRQLEEWERRQRALVVARLALDVAYDDACSGLPSHQRAVRDARAQLETVRQQAWPIWTRPAKPGEQVKPSRYGAVRKAVLTELAASKNCKVCAGRGSRQIEALMVACVECAGTGKRGRSEYFRAEHIGVSAQNYGRWASVYEWTYDLCRGAESKAADAIARALELVQAS